MVAGEQPPTPPEWEAPDDARELDLDRRAWRREQRSRGRRRRLLAVLGPRGSWRLALLLASAVLAVLAVALVVLGPAATTGGANSAPLARPTASVGAPGGLVPPASVRVGRAEQALRRFRPAALAVVGPACGCADALQALGTSARQYGLPVVLVVRDGADVGDLLGAVGGARSFAAVDAAGRVGAAFAASGLTAVIVRGDGVVVGVRRDLAPDTDLGAALADAAR